MMLNTPQMHRAALHDKELSDSAKDEKLCSRFNLFVHTKNVDFPIQHSIQRLDTANYLKAFVPPSLSAQQFMCDSSQKQ